MRPGQLEPNEFEIALLKRFAAQDRDLHLDAVISVPGVPNGLGAILFCIGSHPNVLEIYTFGDEHWDGLYEGFLIPESV